MIVPCLEALDCFLIVLPRLSESFNSVFSSVILEGVLQVDHFLRSHEIRTVMNGYTELVPKAFPLQDVSIVLLAWGVWPQVSLALVFQEGDYQPSCEDNS